ncbi:glycosyltransferase family 2 protein [Adhaeribacter pallidiroseus]|uniref:Putative glycosyltransferase n=1 Tax=Adhaeribacter pallidiroseus TaxID=2072847 RepID=A0A369QLK9_9BACT|nr:glycosyltransferase family 2 protein [Adhaeribacter pallidiroseus]RDC64116.1 putative glycosyltransferase [Adhaeribacter pallidiroseus]
MNSNLNDLYTPLVSIIIPTFNAGSRLNNCLNSVLTQTMSDFEVIVIDANSTDNTLNTLKEFAQKDCRIQWLSESDHGIYDAMNKGITQSRGEWLYFLGSDDYLYNNEVLQTLFGNVNFREYDVLYGNVYSDRFSGLYDGVFNVSKILEKNICHQAIFFNKKVFKKIGIFNCKFKAHADWEHNMRWFLSDKIKSKYIEMVIAYYTDGGFSSVNGDISFHETKILTYLKHAHKLLTFTTKVKLFRDALYIKRKSASIKGVFQALRFIPYLIY